MSIQSLAKTIQSRGRGKDSMLVHMSPREVNGLQALAKAHGGSLTVHPETGLPEAGFLENILPAVVGGVVGFATGMPWLGAAAAGLGGAAMNNGDIGAGITSAMGAYGLGSLGTTVAGMGAQGALGTEAALSTGPVSDAAAAAAANTSKFANLGSGMAQVGADPSAFFSKNVGDIAMAASPLLSLGAGDTQDTSEQSPSYIRPYDYNYATQQFTPQTPVLASDWGSRSFAEGGTTTPTVNPNQQAIQGYYQQYLGRQADQPGLDYWTNRAAQGTTLPDIQREFMQTPEYMRAQVAPQYQNVFGRTADQPGLNYWADKMKEGMPLSDIRAQMVQSPEFQSQVQASQARQQAASGMRPPRNNPSASPAQQIGESLMSQRYQQPQSAVSPSVANYNQMLANQANYEYVNMPGLDAMRPRSPQELQMQKIAREERAAATKAAMDAGGAKAGQAAQKREQDYLQSPEFRQFMTDYLDEMLAKNPNLASSIFGQGDGTGPQGGIGSMAEAEADAAAANASAADMGGEGEATGGLIRKKLAAGGISSLGSYSDGGRLLRGPGDGVSDSIPATIAGKQPARLADGEFVVPARIVSELGNGSTEAGARKLYSMMDRIQKKRGKTTGKNKVAVNSLAYKELPA